MIMPAIITPKETAAAVVLGPKFKRLAAKVPVHAPVPGTAAAGGGNDFSAGFLSLFQKLTARSSNVLLLGTPKQKLTGKQINEGNRDHIADHTGNQCGKIGKIHAHSEGNGKSQLQNRDHRNEKYCQILDHRYS